MRTILIAIPLVALAFAVRAERAPMSPAGLEKTATHVVDGTVQHIYTRQARRGGYEVTHYIAEVKVAKVHKGDGLAAGGLVYVRYWTQRWIRRNAPPPGTNGYRGLPKEGETLKIHLARNAYDGFTKANNDGGFNVVGPNGFVR